jgi:hypothetical protein
MNGPYKHLMADVRTDNQPFTGAAPGTIVILSDEGAKRAWWSCPLCSMNGTMSLSDADYDASGPSLKPKNKEWIGPTQCCGTRWRLKDGWWIWDGRMPSTEDLKSAGEYRAWVARCMGEIKERMAAL